MFSWFQLLKYDNLLVLLHIKVNIMVKIGLLIKLPLPVIKLSCRKDFQSVNQLI